MEQRDQSLRHSLRDGAAHAVLLGAGEAYLIPLAIFLGADHFLVGLLASAPLMLSGLAQLASVRFLDRAQTRRRLTIIPAMLQGLALMPAALVAWWGGRASPWFLLLIAVGYHLCAGLVMPAWSSWIAELVPAEQRGAFFGRRNRIRTAIEFASVTAAGVVLALSKRLAWEALGFVVVMLVSSLARLISAREMNAMHEPPYRPPEPHDAFSLWAFLWRAPRANFGRFTIYVALFLAATHVAGPFFTPFMLNDLGFGYLAFTLASVSFIAAQAATMQLWGTIGDRFGNRQVLVITGLLLPIVPIGWVFATGLVVVVILQVAAGVLWSGFHLCAANFLFDAVTPQKRARCVAYYNMVTNFGLFCGAMLGGAVASHVPTREALEAVGLPLVSGLQVVFVASGVLRLVATLVLFPLVREVRAVEPGRFRDVVVFIAGQSPLRGVRWSVFGGARRRETRPP